MEFMGGVHWGFMLGTLAFVVLTMWLVSRMNYKNQNRMFVFGVIGCCVSCIFRFAMQNSFTNGFRIDLLARSWLQVCNFNFILLPLMLIPKFNIARQYAILFSFASAVTGIVGCGFDEPWYDPEVLSYWAYHIFAIATPLWMVAARRLKPEKQYVVETGFCVFMYFTIVAVIVTICVLTGAMGPKPGYSFIYDPSGVGIFEWLYSLIQMPYFYLYPVFPVIMLLFYLVSLAFKKYEVVPFNQYFVKDDEFYKKHPKQKERLEKREAKKVEKLEKVND